MTGGPQGWAMSFMSSGHLLPILDLSSTNYCFIPGTGWKIVIGKENSNARNFGFCLFVTNKIYILLNSSSSKYIRTHLMGTNLHLIEVM